jgi:mRNA interferase RelE/StbE
MTYEIILSNKAIRQLKKLDKATRVRIVAALERIRIRPESYVTKLVGDPGYRLRVGVYRVILDIDNERKKLFVLIIGHRRNIYSLNW